MGLVFNVILLCFCLSFALYFGGVSGTLFTEFVGLTPSSSPCGISGFLSGMCSDLFNAANAMRTVSAGAVALGVFGLLTNNTVAMRMGFVVALLTFFTFPINLFEAASFPLELKLFLGGFFALAYAAGIASFVFGEEI